MILVDQTLENIVEKVEVAGNQHIYEEGSGFSPKIFEGMVAFSGVVKLGSITNITQSVT